jgi:DNA-directed RNA polymerase III subunit RPC2
MDIVQKNDDALLEKKSETAQFVSRSTSSSMQWGQVRASLLGSCLSKKDRSETSAYHTWRKEHMNPIEYPIEGFDHVHGQNVIDEIDNHPLGTARLDLDEKKSKEVHDYGSEKTPADAPVGSLKEKWRLLPYFLQLRSILRQHIDSFDHFVEVEMKEIVASPSACEIRSDHDPKFYLRYEACWVGEPSIDEESYSMIRATPFQCRLRDCTYSAPIYVNVRYTRGHQIVVKRNVIVGRMPIMLRSKNCVLRDKTEEEQVLLKECCFDPGGYFVVKGVEKVILIQEQLSKNRVILEEDAKGICASITSSTHERKSKSYVLIKHGRVYLKNNTLGDDIPIVIVLKAMGIESDLELVQLVGSESILVNAMALSLEESSRLKILTQQQALKYIGLKIRGRANAGSGIGYRKPMPPEDEAREVLAFVVLSHVPVENFHFRPKSMYIGHVVRRVLLAHLGKIPLDDKDYYGNKRLELAGNLLSLLFEDLFKIFSKDLKRQADLVLSKPNRAQAFDIVKCIRPDTITNGMINAISTGHFILKRFKMDRQVNDYDWDYFLVARHLLTQLLEHCQLLIHNPGNPRV